MQILALIPARGGSKGIPGKNLRLLAGKPLVAHAIEQAEQSTVVSRIIVSTDDIGIAEAAKKAGAEVPFMRPRELAEDNTPTLPVVRHALQWLMQHEKYRPDVVVLLQPTSPLRRAEHIDQGVRLLLETKADSVVSLCEAEHSPYWMKVLDEKGKVKPFIESEDEYPRRQDLPIVYRLNGAIYATWCNIIAEKNKMLGDDIRALVMTREDSVDIDDEIDFLLAELLLVKRRQEGEKCK